MKDTDPTDADAGFIKAKFRDAEASQRRSLRVYRDAGQRLAWKNFQLGHGKWLEWLKANDIDQQRDSECRRLRDGWGKLPPGGTFGLKEALRLIGGDTKKKKGKSADSEPTPEAEVDDALIRYVLPPDLSAEVKPTWQALKKDWPDVLSVTVELYRRAGKEVARG